MQNPRVEQTLEQRSVIILGSTGSIGTQAIDVVESDADRDHWFDADEALAYGMVDHIVDRPRLL